MPELDFETLYPFLSTKTRERALLDTALLQSITAKAQDGREVQARFFDECGPQLLVAARAMAQLWQEGGRLFTIGNGGSHCDAAHVAVEFLHPVTAGRPALPAVHLGADTAMLSAVGNDLGFEHVFVRQLTAQARRGDGLLGLSTSGNAANIMAAFAKARELGMTTIGLTGGDGGRMRSSGLVEHCLTVPSPSIHRIQEVHVAIYHVLWDLVHSLMADDRGPGAK